MERYSSIFHNGAIALPSEVHRLNEYEYSRNQFRDFVEEFDEFARELLHEKGVSYNEKDILLKRGKLDEDLRRVIRKGIHKGWGTREDYAKFHTILLVHAIYREIADYVLELYSQPKSKST